MDASSVTFSFFLIFTGAAIFASVALYTRQPLIIAYIALGAGLGALILFGLLNLGIVLFSRASGAMLVMTGPRLRVTIRKSLFSYLQHHSHRYFVSHFAGSLANRIAEVSMSAMHSLWTITFDFYPLIIKSAVAKKEGDIAQIAAQGEVAQAGLAGRSEPRLRGLTRIDHRPARAPDQVDAVAVGEPVRREAPAVLETERPALFVQSFDQEAVLRMGAEDRRPGAGRRLGEPPPVLDRVVHAAPALDHLVPRNSAGLFPG